MAAALLLPLLRARLARSLLCGAEAAIGRCSVFARDLSSGAGVLEERKEEADAVVQELEGMDLSFPTYIVWGANTDVGKTLVSAGLAGSILGREVEDASEREGERRRGRDVLYLKPVQTGFPHDSDARFVFEQVCRRAQSRGEGVVLSNRTLEVSPAVHAAMKEFGGESLRVREPGLVRSQGMVELCRYEEQVVGFDKEMEAGSGAASRLSCETVWSWYDPVSPHLAAAKEETMVSDSAVVQTVKRFLWKMGGGSDALRKKWVIVETAGGIASPAPSGTLQCDLYRPLRLPSLLVGDGKLGGISTTIAAYESLQLRGYDTDAVVLVDSGLGNEEALRKCLPSRVPILCLPPVPAKSVRDLADWYARSGSVFAQLRNVLEEAHLHRLNRLRAMPAKAMRSLWWPFTQHSLVSEEDVTVIDSRCGGHFSVFKIDTASNRPEIRKQFDGCASWWTQGPNAELQLEFAREMAYAAGRYGHVMFPENVYEPSLRCTELLLSGPGRGWADRVYFSDNGSTAIEIAIKMAFRKFAADHGYVALHESGELSSEHGLQFKVLALKGSYHGDTLGAMEAQAPSAYTGFLQQPWYSGRGLFLDPPTMSLQAGRHWLLHLPEAYRKLDPVSLVWNRREDIFAKCRDNTTLAEVYSAVMDQTLLQTVSEHGTIKIAALIMEPVVHGAGGMHMLDPLFQRVLVRKCRQHGIPVIFDEVFAGCWRLGTESAAELLHITPDIACYAKLLTGGMVPMATTLASEAVYNVFRSQSKLNALLHGHSYSANPLGCMAAVTALKSFADPAKNPNLLANPRRLQELWNPQLVNAISRHQRVERVVHIGTLFALELRSSPSKSGYASMQARWLLRGLMENGVHARPLGNVVYLLVGPTTEPDTCSHLLETLLAQLSVEQNEAEV